MGQGFRDDQAPGSADLLAAARHGDATALATLLERHLPLLRAFVRLQITDALRARERESDLVQSVCLEIVRRADRFEDRGEPAFRSWLYQAVLHEIRDHERYWKARKRRPEHGELLHDTEALAAAYHSLSPSRAAVAIEDLERMEAAFARMPPDHARALVLARFAGLDVHDIAAELGRTVGATQQLLRRAQVRLSALLAERPPSD